MRYLTRDYNVAVINIPPTVSCTHISCVCSSDRSKHSSHGYSTNSILFVTSCMPTVRNKAYTGGVNSFTSVPSELIFKLELSSKIQINRDLRRKAQPGQLDFHFCTLYIAFKNPYLAQITNHFTS